MNLLRTIIALAVYLIASFTEAQELPPTKNFLPTEYNAGNQNWSVSQSADKLIYVANDRGLLEFNGATWQLYPSPNETIMRSVNVIDGRVYTGCYMDFGYWEKTTLGTLTYTSLSSNLEVDLIEDEEFWRILGVERWVVFQSKSRIYIYDVHEGSINSISTNGVIHKMFVVNETIYFQKYNNGLYNIENGKESLVIDHPRLRDSEVVNMFEDGNELIVLTNDQGFLEYTDGQLVEWTDKNDELEKYSVYDAIRMKNERFALGTISNGLVYFDTELGIIHEISQRNGLQNNTVLSVFEDADGNIWTGLDNGISYINESAPISIYNDKNGILGSVYASAIFENQIYLGTNQGLYHKPLDGDAPFVIVPNTEGQVWSLDVIENQLFCGHHKGTLIIENTSIIGSPNLIGTWSVKHLGNEPGLLISGNYDGLYILEKTGTKSWRVRNKIDGFEISSRSFELLGSKIFVNHEYKGVFQLDVDTSFMQVLELKLDSHLKGANSSVAKFNERIIYAYQKGILAYDDKSNSFIQDSTLSTIYTDLNYTSGKIISNKEHSQFWAFTKDNLISVSSGKLSELPKIKYYPLAIDVRRDVVEYENLTRINSGSKYLIGTSFGYIILDQDKFIVDDFEVELSAIMNGINSDHSVPINLIDQSTPGIFDEDQNNIQIRFHTPTYREYLSPKYQFQLEGLYDDWSEWNNKSNVFFENLPSGNYTFNVRARLGDKLSSNVASYEFRVTKPWYLADIMVSFYIVGILLVALFMHHTYRRYYHNKQRKLIEQNKRDLEFAKLQNEKEIIKLKNDQLKQDVKAKSNELAASTMSMVRKNELLSEIKQLLNKVNDQKGLSPVITLIDKNLDHDENWEFFREAFDSADSEFFKKIKKLHPDLSPNDLKLCAYLRLNLSSKEVAQLINISPKSVEIKRYRLRKKMNLESNQNLIDYIISI